MSYITTWIADNWAMIALSLGGTAATVAPIVIAIIKLFTKRLTAVAESNNLNSVVASIKLLQNKLNLINTAIVSLIDITGSESAKAKYNKAANEAAAIEKELNTILDEFVDKTKSTVEEVTNVVAKAVKSIDTNKTSF